MREILSLHIGQAGIQIGDACWELFCLEHGIELDGSKGKKDNDIENNITQPYQSFFEETAEGKYRPRSIFVDLEPTVLDGVRNGLNKQLYFPDQLISSKEDTGNNFARCHNTIGKDIMNTLLDKIRKITEKCSDFEGFLVFNSVGGGIGSGFGSLLLEQLQSEYCKKLKFGINLFSSEKPPGSVFEPFNSVFCSSDLINQADISFTFDNAQIFDVCLNRLGIPTPSLNNMNQLTAQVISSITASIRFGGELNYDLNEIHNNLVVFPRLHFLTSSYSPIFPATQEMNPKEDLSVVDITTSLLDSSNNLAQFNPKNNYLMANTIMYRGDIVPKYVSIAFNKLKEQRVLNYFSGTLSKIRLGVNYQPPSQQYQPQSILGQANKDCSMLSNSTGVGYIFRDLKARYDLLHEKKTFVQHYLNEGMEEQELTESRENIDAIEKEYQQILEESIKQNLATSEIK